MYETENYNMLITQTLSDMDRFRPLEPDDILSDTIAQEMIHEGHEKTQRRQ